MIDKILEELDDPRRWRCFCAGVILGAASVEFAVIISLVIH